MSEENGTFEQRLSIYAGQIRIVNEEFFLYDSRQMRINTTMIR